MKNFNQFLNESNSSKELDSSFMDFQNYELFLEDFGTHYSPSQLAIQIQDALGGLGTDEERFANLITSLRNKSELEELNKIMSSNPNKFTYSSLEDAIEQELGMFDDEAKTKIQNHLSSLGEGIKKKTSLGRVVYSKILNGIKERVIFHEGKKYRRYNDSKGIPTIGVGFNLKNKNVDARLKSVGANPKLIKSGKAELSDSQIDKLLMEDLKVSYDNARSLLPNFESLPERVQGVLVEMAFNLGKSGLGEFKRFLKYISMKQWAKASREMLNSSWSSQVGDRSKRLSNVILGKNIDK